MVFENPKTWVILPFFILTMILFISILFSGMSTTTLNKILLYEKIFNIENNCTIDSECNNGICYFGKCICNPGYYGDNCLLTCGLNISSIEDAYCFEDDCCNDHGECWYYKCLCTDGYYGKFCQNYICPNLTNINDTHCTTDSNCNYNGEDNTGNCYYGKCLCNPNYAGDLCNLERRDLSYCSIDDDCENGGKCFKNNHDTGECYCPSTTVGNSCESLI